MDSQKLHEMLMDERRLVGRGPLAALYRRQVEAKRAALRRVQQLEQEKHHE